MDGANRIVSVRSGNESKAEWKPGALVSGSEMNAHASPACVSGREWSDWSSELRIPGDELKWKFTSDGSVNGWGWRFTVYPIMPAAGEESSNVSTNQTPSMSVACFLLLLYQMISSQCH